MFNFIRKYRGFFSIIFVLAAAGMIFSLFGTGGAGMDGGGGFFNRGNAAKVLGERISVNEFAQTFDFRWREAQATFNKQFEGQNTDPQTRAFLQQLLRSQVSPQSVLEGMIQQRFVIAVAEERGLKVPPSAVRYLLEKNPAFQKDGRFDPITYRQFVARPGDYERQLKQQLLRESIFYNSSIPLAVVSESEVEEARKLRERFEFELLNVDPSKVELRTRLSDADINAKLEDPATLQELSSYFEGMRSRFETAEQVSANHILIRKEEGGEKKAAEVRQEIVDGKISFADAAKKHSSDKANAEKGGALGFFEKQMMDPSFAEAAFALSPEQKLSGVVESVFGFHIIEFVDRKAATSVSFEEVKAEVAREYLEKQAKRDFALAQLQKATESGSAPASMTRALGSKWEAARVWTPLDDSLGAVSVTNLDLGALLSLEAGKLYPKVVPQGESFFLLRLKSRQEAELNERELMAEKGANAIQSYLAQRMKKLEEDKKIYRNEELLSQFQEQLSSM